MRDTMAYINARLAEDGTKRSLAVILFGIAGAGNSEALWEAVVNLGVIALGFWSAAQPAKPPAP